MKNANRVLCCVFVSSALIGFSACGGSGHSPTEKYILVSANVKLPYWQTAFAGLNRAASEMKVKSEMVGPDTYDPKAEHDDFQRAIAEKPSGIMVSAADANVIAPDINAAIAQNIPVITMDSDAPNSKRLFFVGTDNYNAGTLGGHLAARLLNGKGNVVIFTIPTQTNLQERLHGYQDAFAEHPEIKITQIVDMKGDPTVAFDTSRRMLDSKTKVDAFICLEASAGPEVGDVVNRENMAGKLVVLAMDTDQRTTDWIQKGVISATIAQKPFTMGYYGTKLLDDLHHHPPSPLSDDWAQNPLAPIPTFVDTGAFVVDKTNVASVLDKTKSVQVGQ